MNKQQLSTELWSSINQLRSTMDATEYKDYIIGFIFYRFLSENQVEYTKKHNETNSETIKNNIGYFITNDNLFNTWLYNTSLSKDVIKNGLISFNDSIQVEYNHIFKNIFNTLIINLSKNNDSINSIINLFEIIKTIPINKDLGYDVIGFIYEYLIEKFAGDAGKKAGEFYTPHEVSVLMSKIITQHFKEHNNKELSIYDPTSGSGTLLINLGKELINVTNKENIKYYAQELKESTFNLTRMNLVINNTVLINNIVRHSNTLEDNWLSTNGDIVKFNAVVSNPPYSQSWNPLGKENDERYAYGLAPKSKADFAFLLHDLYHLKPDGIMTIVLPHGVLFRGGIESEIRQKLIKANHIDAIIGLPADIFFGTDIPTVIIVLKKYRRNTDILIVDASKEFIKDGNKNRLRERDIHKIVDVFNSQIEIPKYSRFVSYDEISNPKNDFNLNIPRYIDSQEIEDIQDIEAHLLGGIPNADITALNEFWEVYPNLRTELFKDDNRPNYSQLKISKDEIKSTIFNHHEFLNFSIEMDELFNVWKTQNTQKLKGLDKSFRPKEIIQNIAEDILAKYSNKNLMDKYAVYQHIMDYWNSTMQDDAYLIAVDGWVAEPYRIIVVNDKTKKETDKGWECDLVPKILVIERYFKAQQQIIEQLEADKEAIALQFTELEENLPDGIEEDEWILNEVKNEKGKITKTLVDNKTRELKRKILNIPMDTPSKEITKNIKNNFEKIQRNKENNELFEQLDILEKYNNLVAKDSEITAKLKTAIDELDNAALERYKTLTEDEIKQLVVDDKWMANIEQRVKTEMERISQRLTRRIKELAERYETTLPNQTNEVAELEAKVMAHLQKMGFAWN